MPPVIRLILDEEISLLNEFLYRAIFIPPNVDPPPRSIIRRPELQIYVKDFGANEHDHALVAIDEKVVGAMWARIMNDYGHVDDQTPSLAIAVRRLYERLGFKILERRGDELIMLKEL